MSALSHPAVRLASTLSALVLVVYFWHAYQQEKAKVHRYETGLAVLMSTRLKALHPTVQDYRDGACATRYGVLYFDDQSLTTWGVGPWHSCGRMFQRP